MEQIDWERRIFSTSIEIDITLRCNLRCLNCDRAIRHAPGNEVMSVEQIQHFIDETKQLGWKWERLKLIGGEPTLHPQFDKVVGVMEHFHNANPWCTIELWTNGYGSLYLPGWIKVVNSHKTGIRNAFVSFNMAPIDDKRYKNLDFSKGCPLLEHCGLGLNSYGYYPCPAGSTVDRVFGFDIGVKSLREFIEGKRWRQQLPQLCRYCGHFKHQFKREWTRKEKISASWQRAFDDYGHNKLSLY